MLYSSVFWTCHSCGPRGITATVVTCTKPTQKRGTYWECLGGVEGRRWGGHDQAVLFTCMKTSKK